MSQDTARTLATLRGMTAKFDLGVAAATPYWPTKAFLFNSNGLDERYGALGNVPGMREWLGDRIFNQLRSTDFEIVNKLWESSLAIEKVDIEDDRLGMYDMALEQLGREASYHPDELMFSLQTTGDANVCMDGQYFYDTDHSWGDSGTQSNKLSPTAATGTTPTEAEFRTAYHAARAALLGFKNDQGKTFHRPTLQPINDLVLEVPTALEEVANQALFKAFVSSGETNIVLDRPKLVTIPALDAVSDHTFYLHRVGQPLKPFVFQARRPLARQMKGLDDREFKDVKLMADARYNVGYFAWWMSVQSTFT